MANITVTLEWNGVWEITENNMPPNIPDEQGIYMILCGKHFVDSHKWNTSSYKLLYVGEAEKVRSRIAEHEKWPTWKRNCRNHLILKIARCNFGTTKRQKVECCLVFNTKPICNDECKDSFPYKDDTVSITNTGVIPPLKEKYICRSV